VRKSLMQRKAALETLVEGLGGRFLYVEMTPVSLNPTSDRVCGMSHRSE